MNTDDHETDAAPEIAAARISLKDLPTAKVAPFPLARFIKFIRVLKVNTKDFGLVPLKLLGTQLYVLEEICKGLEEGVTTFVILKARQLGMTTFFIALDLFWAFEHSGLLGAFVTHTDQSKAQFRNIIKVFFANLPKTHKISYVTENRDLLILKNGSMFSYMVAGVKQKSTSGLGRSGAFNFTHGTEVAYWGSEEDLQELRATMSTHYPHRLTIYESTANGFNHYNEMWEEALTSKVQRAIFVGWWRNELYAFSERHPWFQVYMPQGEATSLTPLERRRKRLVRELYGADVSAEQIAWYRWKLDDECSGDQSKMDEMFPWTPEDAFVATGSAFFTDESLTVAMRRSRKQAYIPFRYALSDRWQDTAVTAVRDKRADLKIWEEAHPKGYYAIGCDPAYGSSDTADRTVIHVARCFADCIVQVAEFTSPSVSTYQCAWVLAHLAGYYRNCVVNLEITGPGSTVFDELQKLRTDTAGVRAGEPDLRNALASMRYYLYRRPDNITGGGLAYQWRTTAETKTVMMTGFRDAFELNRHLVNSLACLEEMKGVTYVDGRIEAEGRKKDDRVIAAALAHEAWRRWMQGKLQALNNFTYQQVMIDETRGHNQSVVEKIALDYLRQAKVIGEKGFPDGRR